MKTVLPAACIKCGSKVWYVYKSGRRCVPCSHNRAITGRAMIRKLEAEVAQLREANEAFSKRQEWWNERMFELEKKLGNERMLELEKAVAAEREACAKAVERARLQIDGAFGVTHQTDFIATRITDFYVATIRARGGDA